MRVSANKLAAVLLGAFALDRRGRAAGGGPELSDAQHHGDHSVRARQRQRHHRRASCSSRSASSSARPIVIDNRGGAGGTIGVGAGGPRHAGRLHHPVPFGVVQLGLCDAQDAALRHVQRFHRRWRRSAFRRACSWSSPSKGYKTAADLIAAAKAKPGALNFASAGIGAASHLAAEKFNVAAGIKSQHVPFKGPVEALTEVMAGRIDYYFLPIAPALALIKDGKVTALAVSSDKRAPSLPDVPTTAEIGYAEGGLRVLERRVRSGEDAAGRRHEAP